MSNSWNIRFWEYEFLQPHWFWLCLLLPLTVFLGFYRERQRHGDIKFSQNEELQMSLSTSWIQYLRSALILMLNFAFLLLIAALAKPFNPSTNADKNNDFKNGIDIILTIDVSGSMLSEDFKPNRLEAAKSVAKDFIDGRSGDRIGLVVYAGEAYTACPATLDYKILKEQIDGVSEAFLEGGTAIGVGLGTAVTRLRSDSIKSKVIILLTDGSNNAGNITPDEAAELAKAKNIRVYTIGMGAMGSAPTPINTPFGTIMQTLPVEIDEPQLQRIASKTNGKYFRATDESSLRKIYDEIEKLEKRKMINNQFKSDPPAQPMAFLKWALVLMLLAWMSSFLIFRSQE